MVIVSYIRHECYTQSSFNLSLKRPKSTVETLTLFLYLNLQINYTNKHNNNCVRSQRSFSTFSVYQNFSAISHILFVNYFLRRFSLDFSAKKSTILSHLSTRRRRVDRVLFSVYSIYTCALSEQFSKRLQSPLSISRACGLLIIDGIIDERANANFHGVKPSVLCRQESAVDWERQSPRTQAGEWNLTPRYH